MQQTTLPSKSISFTFKSADYEMKFPNTGQLISMLTYKSQLTSGQFENISTIRDIEAQLGVQIVETMAFMSVLCPDLLKSLNINTFSQMELVDMRELVNIYAKKISPWYNEWIKFLNTPLPEIESDAKK